MTKFALKVDDLSLSIEDKMIFKNIDLEIPQGQVSLVSGPSGCGKSVFLMTLAGLVPEYVDAYLLGKIFIDGENILKKSIQELSGKIGFIFQDADSQLCSFNVEDELAFGLENLCYAKEEIKDRIDQVSQALDIGELLPLEINCLSGGQKQKVAIASILAMDPSIIIMDEPTANLDPKATEQIVQLVKILKEDYGKTILLVEHKIQDFSSVIDHVFLMEDGEIYKTDKDKFLNSYKKKTSIEVNPNIVGDENILKVKNLSFSYDQDKKILDNISFCLKNREILAIVGKNGEGKSTLSKLIMGLLRPDEGEIILNNRNIQDLSPREIGKDIGLVFQNPEHQFIEMTVIDELRLSLLVNRADNIEENCNNYLKLFNLYDKKNLNPFSLSQGEKRRLSTASMMINGQKLLILDEPTYGQDPSNMEHLVSLLYKINKQGVSILMVTHDLELIKKSCHRFIFLKEAKIYKEDLGENISKEDFYYE